jgi:hypothetical protein
MRIHRTSSAGLVAVALALALAFAACTSDSTGAGGTTTPTSVPTSPPASPLESPSNTGSPKPTATASPILEDGRSFVYVKKVDVGMGAPSLTFDLALFYTGDEANQIAGDRGDEVPVPNDVYIVNDNPKLRTLPFADDAEVLVYDWHACCDNHTSMTVDRWAGYVDAPTRRFHGKLSPYWITVRGGEIVKAEEQYLP